MWNDSFSITLILLETKFGDLRGAKSAILTLLEAVNFDFDEFLHFLEAEIGQITKVQSHKNDKNGSFSTSRFLKTDFT